MKAKPSLEDFRTGGADAAPAPAPKTAASAPEAPTPSPAAPIAPPAPVHDDSRDRESKTIRIRRSFAAEIRSRVFHRSLAEGRKVNESDIIDAALEEYFRNHPGK